MCLNKYAKKKLEESGKGFDGSKSMPYFSMRGRCILKFPVLQNLATLNKVKTKKKIEIVSFIPHKKNT